MWRLLSQRFKESFPLLVFDDARNEQALFTMRFGEITSHRWLLAIHVWLANDKYWSSARALEFNELMRNLHAWWRKTRRSNRSYRKTSWRHFYLCWRRIAGKFVYNFLQDFGKRKHCLYEHPVEFPSKKLMRYQECCIDAQNPSKAFQNKSHSVLLWDKN
jgi:hypothetical protein